MQLQTNAFEKDILAGIGKRYRDLQKYRHGCVITGNRIISKTLQQNQSIWK